MCDVRRRTWVLLGLLLGLFTGGDALKDVSVTIPPAVKIMDTVTLQCRYDLQGEPLYTVKWYKGGQEFFRYIPKELPSTQVFPLPGINVDLSKSSPNEVVLRNVQPEVTGRYKCEVSSDAPNFYTFIVSGYMYVIGLTAIHILRAGQLHEDVTYFKIASLMRASPELTFFKDFTL
ncbi:hypothetical protein TcasGA2_TC031360 [Tribolium castaneum]|uniref:Ig-like domain-containing protein n=1 Tax=Tribolium castaneum TaxID=7070 RepID=A0A139WKM0_TRICA|nr:hypothetical protein TcasGA2_TC031360 [Tribolium castaneum]